MIITSAPIKDHGPLRDGYPGRIRIKRNWEPAESAQWSVVPANLHAPIRKALLREDLICESRLLEQVRLMPPEERPFPIDEAFEQLATYDEYGIHGWAPTYVRTQFTLVQLREIAHDIAFSWEGNGPYDEPLPLSEEAAASLAATREEIRSGRFIARVARQLRGEEG